MSNWPPPAGFFRLRISLILSVGSLAALVAFADEGKPFCISVVDAETRGGVPLVELKTTANVRYYTDSNGLAAIDEPGLSGRRVFFHVKSHGYEYPKDGLGSAGRALLVKPGVTETLVVQRVNLAERLYRVTGEGIYRDSLLAGVPVPIAEPSLNADVTGCDSVQTAVYRGEVYWFWGDTNRLTYPLGNFHTTGAKSALSDDPAVGVNLRYFANDDGFVRPMAKFPGEGLTWMSGLVVLRDSVSSEERMFAHYARIKSDPAVWFKTTEVGLAEWNPGEERFENVAAFPDLEPFPHGGHTALRKSGGFEYVYFCDPFPLVRVRATPEALADQGAYETLTCLKTGSKSKPEPEPQDVETDALGMPLWRWRPGTVGHARSIHAKWENAGAVPEGTDIRTLRDFKTGKAIEAHRGSLSWNAYRKRWIIVFGQVWALGDIWYAEAPAPHGPWGYATRIVSHENYSFYNPRQHPMFDQAGGRLIYFEGTYTNTFSGNPDKTPRYNYNQIMYRLDLADSRLFLPAPVYESENGFTVSPPGRAAPAAFFAFLSGRHPEGLTAVRQLPGGALATGVVDGGEALPLFLALPPEPSPGEASDAIAALFEVRSPNSVRYTIDPGSLREGEVRGERPVCRVWKSPVCVAVAEESADSGAAE